MNQYNQFQDALTLEALSEFKFSLTPSPKYFVGNTPHGGYLMAIMHKALVSALPHSCAISSSVQYLNRIEQKEILLDVEILKISKGSSSGIVKLIQNNKICAVFSGTCSDFEHMKGFDGLATPLPDIFHSSHQDNYVELNFDKISSGGSRSSKNLNALVINSSLVARP